MEVLFMSHIYQKKNKRIFFEILFFATFFISSCNNQVYIDYDEDEDIKVEAQLDKEGNLNGVYNVYENSVLIISAEYSNNCLDKILIYKDNMGNDLDYGTFEDGNGELKIYNLYGDLREKGNVKNGKKTGLWEYYSNAGLGYEKEYVNGIKKGENKMEIIFLNY